MRSHMNREEEQHGRVTSRGKRARQRPRRPRREHALEKATRGLHELGAENEMVLAEYCLVILAPLNLSVYGRTMSPIRG